VVNGLGAAIKTLTIADASGKVYQASNIAAGQKAPLIKKGQAPAAGILNAKSLFRDVGFTANPAMIKADAEKYLQPNTYIAVLDGNPFIENALGRAASPKRSKVSGIVYGILDPAENNGGSK